MEDFLSKSNVIAVVGVSRDPKKYGQRVFRTLLKKGYHVYGINPNAEEIAGQKIYPNLAALPHKPDVVITVTPPKITEKIVEECIRLNIKRIWMQPGSEAALDKAQAAGIEVISGLCFVVDGLQEKLI